MLTAPKGLIFMGFFIIIMSSLTFRGGPQHEDQQIIPAKEILSGGSGGPSRYTTAPIPNPDTGAIEMKPVISERARE